MKTYMLENELEVTDLTVEGVDQYETPATAAFVRLTEEEDWREATEDELDMITNELKDVCLDKWLLEK